MRIPMVGEGVRGGLWLEGDQELVVIRSRDRCEGLPGNSSLRLGEDDLLRVEGRGSGGLT